MKIVVWFKQLFGHRYFNRIFYLSISSLILLVILATLAFYIYIDNSVTRNTYENDMKMLMQIQKNYENTNKLIINFCKKVFYSPSADKVMYSRPDELEWEEIAAELKNISYDMKSFEPYIHSVYIYNNFSQAYYSAFADSVSETSDVYLGKAILQYNQVPKLMPVLRKIKTNNPETIEYEDVLSYFYYDTADENNRFHGCVIVNIQPEWLLDNLYSLNPNDNGRFLLMASNRKFFNVDNGTSQKYLDDLTIVYYHTIMEKIKNGVTSDIIPCYIGKEKSILSYVYLKDEGFILYKIQTYDNVYAGVKNIKIALLIISASIIIISLFIAFFMAENIYKPFQKLLKSISSYTGNSNDSYINRDELGFLEDSYIRSVNEIHLLKKEINSTDLIKYKYYLTQLLINSDTVTDNEIMNISSSGLFNVNIRDVLTLVILKLDSASADNPAVQSISGWIRNTFSEALSNCYVNDIVYLESKYIVAIINAGANKNEENDKEVLRQVISNMQQKTYNNYSMSYAAIISDPIRSVTKLSETYIMLQRHLSYSYIYGSTAIITTELIEGNLSNSSLNYPSSVEQKLVTGIKEQNYDAVTIHMDDIINKLKKMNYNNITISLMNLCNTINVAINEANKANDTSHPMDLFDINPVDYHTIDEFQSVLQDLIKNSFTDGSSTTKHNRNIKAAKSIIYNEYTDPNLSLVSIAERIKISPNYLNFSFNSICGCSVSDFITDYRLSKAAELLEISDDSINTIMYAVGMENESTFYRRFKLKFGTTPKNYLAGRLYEKVVKSD